MEYLPRVSPTSWSYDAPHLRLIAEHLDAVKAGTIDRLAIFMPPRPGKSETYTVRFPVYLLEDDPTVRCLITGYNQSFARKSRNLAETRMRLSDDKASADKLPLEAVWFDLQSISEEERLNALLLKQQIGASTEQLLSEAGYGAQDIQRIVEENRAVGKRQA